MAIELYRVDDRLVHGQVVVGWGQPLSIGFLVVVDDEVSKSEWEQELYRMGVPPEMDIFFATVEEAAARLDGWVADERPGILLTADIATMARLIERRPEIRHVNLGGIHHRPDRSACVRYVYLTPTEERALQTLAARGVTVSAQDVPGARPISLETLLRREALR